ncbi:MAG: sulfite exporter TauE/SafE family protein [Sphingobium sp.]|nr:sulfite exporter TauE/SafE family protein [Sphingobium sp.]
MIGAAPAAAALASGVMIGVILGLVGGGGSILAVPLLVYFVGVGSTHVAIGTAAVAVAVNAAISLIGHARAGTVKWPCAIAFGLAGMTGAAIGAEFGKAIEGERLLIFFGLLMIGVGLFMLRPKRAVDLPDVKLSRGAARMLLPRLLLIGFGVGLAAGFFGIGGGFLIVPGLMLATAMPLRYAVGTSLAVVTALGLTTAISYALSGYVDWLLVGLMVAGGAGGGLMGIKLGQHIGASKGAMEKIFAFIVIMVGVYVTAGAL